MTDGWPLWRAYFRLHQIVFLCQEGERGHRQKAVSALRA